MSQAVEELEAPSVSGALAAAQARLGGGRGPVGRLEAEVLLAHLLGCTRTGLYVRAGERLEPAIAAAFRRLVERRGAGEPVAYLTGSREFHGRAFLVDERVLVPRPETELLVEEGLRRLDAQVPGRALDLCTGSGAVGLSLALERPDLHVLACDLSPGALEVARVNRLRFGLEGRVELALGDLYEPVPEGERFSLILANPPYIGTCLGPAADPEVVRFEPAQALFGGADGLAVIEPLIARASRFLQSGGGLALEISAWQAARVEELLLRAGFSDIRERADLQGQPRVLSAAWEER